MATVKSNKNRLTRAALTKHYTWNINKYRRLAVYVEGALETLLNDARIPVLAVYARVKSRESFVEKVGRKSYRDPIQECEDLCGVRVICYYESRIEPVGEIINREFDVREKVDKSSSLGAREFGYRSTHYVVRLKRRWLGPPIYRDLAGAKAEIQVRTIAMHAWAEIEHKLAYKKKEDIPVQFQRSFALLSAKFEEADRQFDQLRQDLIDYRIELMSRARDAGVFDKEEPLSLDTLKALLQFYFPDRLEAESIHLGDLLDELTRKSISTATLVESAEIAGKRIDEFESLVSSKLGWEVTWNQVGALRYSLDTTHPDYYEERLPKEEKRYTAPIIEEFRRRIGIPVARPKAGDASSKKSPNTIAAPDANRAVRGRRR